MHNRYITSLKEQNRLMELEIKYLKQAQEQAAHSRPSSHRGTESGRQHREAESGTQPEYAESPRGLSAPEVRPLGRALLGERSRKLALVGELPD